MNAGFASFEGLVFAASGDGSQHRADGYSAPFATGFP